MKSDFEFLLADKDVAGAINSLVEVIISSYRRKIQYDQMQEVDEYSEKMSNGVLSAKEVCDMYDCNLNDLKKYEKHGLIPVRKSPNGRRVFNYAMCEIFFCYIVDDIR